MNTPKKKQLHSPTVIITDKEEKIISPWETISPEILALVFVRVPADELVRSVALVCKAWLAAVAGPYCWTDIDVEQWCRRCTSSSDVIDSAVRKLVRRSKCTFQRLSAYRLGNSGFSFCFRNGGDFDFPRLTSVH
ncbi:hypothetical protein LguiA_010749 [Lonicera macranthoides]